MRSWPGCLLLVVPVLLLGAREPVGDSLRLRVLVAVYPDTFSDAAGPGEIDDVWAEVQQVVDHVQRSSGTLLQLEIDRVVIDRYLPRDDFQEVTPGSYWLSDQVRGERLVENHLLASGRRPDQYDVVAVFYAWENKPSSLSSYGAASFEVDRILGKAAYLAVPMAWGADNLSAYFEHELLHCLESIFARAGHTDFPPIHNGWAFEATYKVDSEAWYAWVLGNIPYRDYLDRPGPWGTIVRSSERLDPSG